MNPIAVPIAETIKDLLNGYWFSLPFVAERLYVPRYTLEEFGTLRVSVVPGEIEAEALARSSTQFDVAIDIGVQQRLDQATAVTDGDDLMALVDEIAGFLRFQEVAGAKWLRSAHRVPFFPAHLDQQHLFTAILRVTYRVTR